jgi:hypothetical protein
MADPDNTQTQTPPTPQTTGQENNTQQQTQQTTQQTTTPGQTTPPVPPTDDNSTSNVQSRIDVLTARAYEANRQREAAERKAAELEAQMQAFQAIEQAQQQNNSSPGVSAPNNIPPGQRTYTAEDVQREAQRLAVTQGRQLAMRQTLDNAVAAGRTKYQDFDAVTSMLTRGAPLPPVILDALVANHSEGICDAQDVVYALGKNLGEADRILSLPPERQAIALTRFALDVKAKTSQTVNPLTRTSQAPPPIQTQVDTSGGGSTGDIYDENLPVEEFMRIRKAQSQRAAS